ncbi:hypothetical protein [Pyramidobacter sp. C12-8]|uniref:hypothetical protein n=1 Tax=Pyramidobacter sp. C12-8 TaxID=1943580 RepID=UPI00143C1537|nr:hypothetical protein [Pyramidobacter sp. C12-8]
MKKASSQKMAVKLFPDAVSPGNRRGIDHGVPNFYKAKMPFHQEENQCNIVYVPLCRAPRGRCWGLNRTKPNKIFIA